MFKKIASHLAQLTKWQHAGLVFLLGVVTSLGLPPLNFSLLIFLTLPTLILILDGRFSPHVRARRKFMAGFATGWWFGFGYFVTSLYWIGASFLVEADKFAVFLPFAVLALPAGLAIFWGMAFGISQVFWRHDASRVLILAVFLSAAEWLRGHVFTGFPWNSVGYLSDGLIFTNQFASVVGVYGLGLAILVWGFSPLCFIGKNANKLLGVLLVLSFCSVSIWGYVRQNSAMALRQKAVTVRIVQANIPQKQKWAPQFRARNIRRYFDLSKSNNPNSGKNLGDIDILVWPESALPMVYEHHSQVQKHISSMLPARTLLLMGALRRVNTPALIGTKTPKRTTIFNSIIAVNSRNQTLPVYDKAHLVPFGEYLPGESFLAPLGLRKIVDVPAGFDEGKGSKTIKINGYPAYSALVCYEIIFPGQVIDAKNRPDWIVNVTNDAWFGPTAGPYQHLAQTRFRAIETGLPIIRAANTGMSAIIDGYGKVIKYQQLETTGVLDGELPPTVPSTLYSKLGDFNFFVLLLCVLIFIGLTRLQKFRNDAHKVS